MRLKFCAFPFLALSVSLSQAADLGDISSVLKSILAENDESRIPKLTEKLATDGTADAIDSATAEDIAGLLISAKDCLLSQKEKVRAGVLPLIFSIKMRPDSSSLLEPYIDYLGTLLKQTDAPVRAYVLIILGGTLPSPSPKTLSYLAAHVRDKNTAIADISVAAAGLLNPNHPLDPSILKSILDVVHERSDPGLTNAILQQMGLYQISHAEALKFVKASLNDVNPNIRRTAVEASGRMRRDVKWNFTSELLRIASSSEETAETRSLAERALRQ